MAERYTQLDKTMILCYTTYMLTIKKVYGPYTRADGRKHVIIIYTNKIRQTVSYPKYLMEQHLGRELEPWETVDHINEDFTDDRLENLQILSRLDNYLKSVKPAELVTFTCPECGNEATKYARTIRNNQGVQRRAGPFCSRSCAGKYGKKVQIRLDEEYIALVVKSGQTQKP